MPVYIVIDSSPCYNLVLFSNFRFFANCVFNRMRLSFISLAFHVFIAKAGIARLDGKFAEMDREFTWKIQIDGIWKDELDDGDGCCSWSYCFPDKPREELNKPVCIAAMYENLPDNWVKGPMKDKLIEVMIIPHFSDEVKTGSELT